MAAPAFLFTSQTEMETYISVTGLLARVDDNKDGDTVDSIEVLRIAAAINFGTLEVAKYIQRRYLPAQLYNSELVRYFATMFGCAYLCRTKGNGVPESLAEELDEIRLQLADIRDGKLDVPDIAERGSRSPVAVNLRADARFARPLRRQENQSTPRGDKSQASTDYADMIIDPR